MTPELYQFFGFGLAFISLVGTAWWRLDAMIKAEARQLRSEVNAANMRAEAALKSIAEFRTHVAENYVTNRGLKDAFEPIVSSVLDVKRSLDGLNGRIDRIVDGRPTRRSSSAS